MLFDIPFFSTRLVRHDDLHVLYVREVCGHIPGGIFIANGKQSVKPSDRLTIIFSQVQEKDKLFESSATLTNLKLSMVVTPRCHIQAFPSWNAKGQRPNTMPGSNQANPGPAVPRRQNMVKALQAFVYLVGLFEQGDLFLSRAEYSQALDLVKRFFGHYPDLADWASSQDRMPFHVVVKFHALAEIYQEDTGST